MGGAGEGEGEGGGGQVVCCEGGREGGLVSGALEGMGGRGERGLCTGWMGRFKDPVCIFGVGYYLVMPFNLEMAGGFLEERGPGEGVDV